MPDIDVNVLDTLQRVTWIDGPDTNTMRIVWHRAGGPAERFEVRLDGESRHDAIARELRKRLQDPLPDVPSG